MFAGMQPAHARTMITDWYIKDLQSEIVVNKDSSLTITENIQADCGDLPEKHGIFRIVPLYYQKTATEKINMPVHLISITDFNGNKLNYSTIEDTYNKTLTWKIGDADRTVQGVNNYRIKYKVENAIRTYNEKFDEFYWNLNGAFWDLEIDNFSAKIIFPTEIGKNNTQIDYYTGSFGTKDKSMAKFDWQDDHTLVFQSLAMLPIKNGITASVTFPKGIVTPYVIPWWVTYWWIFEIFFFFIPVVISLFAAISLWWKYGRDPNLHKTIIAEYEPPEKLSPMEIGMLSKHGNFDNSYISAGIIDLAVKKIIKIEEIPKTWLLGSADYKLIFDRAVADKTTLDDGERILLNKLLVYAGNNELLISSLKEKFYTSIPDIEKSVKNSLINKGIFDNSGFKMQTMMIWIMVGMFLFTVCSFALLIKYTIGFPLGMGLGAVFFLIAYFFMAKLSLKGAETLWKTKGFKLFMETAEKYRQQFNEKENIFEKLLPYAMVFGITALWIKKMKEIYGEKYFDSYHPAWYAGASLASFNVDNFSKSLNSMSSSMSSTMSSSPSSSGSGGGGFSGGGGGGGGGGGW